MDKNIDELLDKIEKNEIPDIEVINQLRRMHQYINNDLDNSKEKQSEKNIEDKEIYSKTYYFNEPFLKDHLVFKEQTIIGIAYGSLLINSYFALNPTSNYVRIKNLSFIKPVMLKEDQKNVKIGLYAKSEGYPLQIEIRYKYEGEDGNDLTARGILEHVEKDEFKGLESLERLELGGYEKIKEDEISNIYKTDIIEMFDSYKTISSMYKRKNEVIAQFNLGDTGDITDYVLHPHITNVIFLGLFPILKDQGQHDAFLPFGINEIVTKRTKGLSSGYGKVRIVKQNENIIIFDGDIYDENGDHCVKYRECSLKRLKMGQQVIEEKIGKNKGPDKTEPFKKEKIMDSSLQNQLIGSGRNRSLKEAIAQYIINKLIKYVGNKADITLEINLMDLGVD